MARTIVRGYSFRPGPEESLTKELTTEADTLDQVVSDLHQEGFEHVSIVGTCKFGQDWRKIHRAIQDRNADGRGGINIVCGRGNNTGNYKKHSFTPTDDWNAVTCNGCKRYQC